MRSLQMNKSNLSLMRDRLSKRFLSKPKKSNMSRYRLRKRITKQLKKNNTYQMLKSQFN